ncbi:Aga1p [Rhodotorula toruloides ATCC 204091]|uniref:BY PROTMAP: gi/342319599/gb/EGU11546.1/ Aga1p [Rhodotorula glutinis ATCC 204091] n=1 Tax=Rhodotorula toruloides TaxID=5286 RepID=A0A0K3CJE0_RHOTO|nr:Aga1p [Rhodotorula toruloides ATCC 204091]KAK4336439.1 Aga1p [Rhodotorula toruloides]PRQ74208.1 hypothetical protein AAT19DRAFT_14561 [Rhodotorula toruloides]
MAVTAPEDLVAPADTGRATSQALVRTTASTGGPRTDEASVPGQGQATVRRTTLLDLPDELLARIYQFLRATRLQAIPLVGHLDCLFVNKRVWRLDFAVWMEVIDLEGNVDLFLPQLLTIRSQQNTVRDLTLDVHPGNLRLVANAVANLPALSQISITIQDGESVPSKTGAFCLETLSKCSSLTNISLCGFDDVYSADCSNLSFFSPSLRNVSLDLETGLTTFILRRCPGLRNAVIYCNGADIPAIPWDTVEELEVSFLKWRGYMSYTVNAQLKGTLFRTNPPRSSLRSLHLHIVCETSAPAETKLSARGIVSDILSVIASSDVSTVKITQARESEWPVLGGHVAMQNVKTLILDAVGWDDGEEDDSWSSLVRFLSHFPALVRLSISHPTYRKIMEPFDDPACMVDEFQSRLDPPRLFTDFSPLAALLAYTRTLPVLDFRLPARYSSGLELRATRARRDQDFTIERVLVIQV